MIKPLLHGPVVACLERRRAALGLTYRQLAGLAKLPVVTVHDTLSGRTKQPSWNVLVAIAGAVGWHVRVDKAKV